MDSHRFDALTRMLASGLSRRHALRALAGGLVGGAVVGLGEESADARARCRGSNEICRKPGDCCDHFCGPKDRTGRQRCGVCPDGGGQCGTGECCGRGQDCLNGACCDNVCGSEGSEFCCGAQTCVRHFTGQFTEYSCCAPELACNDNTQCCGAGEVCSVSDGCCALEDVCVDGNGGNHCCPDDPNCNCLNG